MYLATCINTGHVKMIALHVKYMYMCLQLRVHFYSYWPQPHMLCDTGRTTQKIPQISVPYTPPCREAETIIITAQKYFTHRKCCRQWLELLILIKPFCVVINWSPIPCITLDPIKSHQIRKV